MQAKTPPLLNPPSLPSPQTLLSHILRSPVLSSMACDFTSSIRLYLPLHSPKLPLCSKNFAHFTRIIRKRAGSEIRAVQSEDHGGSYLDMWSNDIERQRNPSELERKTDEFQKIVEGGYEIEEENQESELMKKTEEFEKILEVPKEERDKIQRLQVIDRAAAAIAAARALLSEKSKGVVGNSGEEGLSVSKESSIGGNQEGTQSQSFSVNVSQSADGTPGPNFWLWSPPPSDDNNSKDINDLQTARQSSLSLNHTNPLLEKERSADSLQIPFESTLLADGTHPLNPLLPPLQSLVEIKKMGSSDSNLGFASEVMHDNAVDEAFSRHAAEAASALGKDGEASSYGFNPDGSRWWRETGFEQRPDGVVCKWTMTRGVSSIGDVEWEEKYWEASDQFDYKELGSEKSGRDAEGNIWREYWNESMWQDRKTGLVHMEKTADKWGKNGNDEEWQEKWWEHYDASGQAEKWAHKWCSIDPTTPLEAGHAHVWHERWGESYDGKGGSAKYTDKWAERAEGDMWTKWGDKWDESFDWHGHGVKQGETWWEGAYGERWNRTWGEQHNGSGWVHKYGKSSSGEHWDTHAEEETWYERFPHFGFHHCFENSVHLREVKPIRTNL